MISSMGAIYCGSYFRIAASKLCPFPKVVQFSTQYIISVLNGAMPPLLQKNGAIAPGRGSSAYAMLSSSVLHSSPGGGIAGL